MQLNMLHGRKSKRFYERAASYAAWSGKFSGQISKIGLLEFQERSVARNFANHGSLVRVTPMCSLVPNPHACYVQFRRADRAHGC